MREMDLNGDGVIDWIEYVKQDDGAWGQLTSSTKLQFR